MIHGGLYIPRRRGSVRNVYLQNPSAKCKYMYLVLILLFQMISSCKTPQVENKIDTETHHRAESQISSAGDETDTTTIMHHLVDSNTMVTKIIRRTIYENQISERSNSDTSKKELETRKDSLTPELIKAVIKGFAVACIGGGLMVLGFFITVVILLVRVIKGH